MKRIMTLALVVGILFAAAGARAQDKPKADKPAEQPAAQAPKEEAKMDYVLMKTSMGEMTIELNTSKSPITVANFLSYVDKKFYDGTIFHRVIAGFMIQGGGMDAGGKEKTTDKPIKNEWKNGLKNVRGSISMARLGGGPNSPDSATSQFFINTVDNPGLDRPQADGAAYCAFGRVVVGMDVVDKIRNVKVVPDSRGEVSKPTEVIKIESVRRLTAEEVTSLKGKIK